MSKTIQRWVKLYEPNIINPKYPKLNDEDTILSYLEEKCFVDVPERLFTWYEDNAFHRIEVAGKPKEGANAYLRRIKIETMPPKRPLPKELSDYLNTRTFEKQ